jgi:D-alanyl-D-alanine carboxypeptidase
MRRIILDTLAVVLVVVAVAMATVATTGRSAIALGGLDAGIAVVSAPDGNGYAIVSAKGGQYNYGSSRFSGSLAGQQLAAPIVDAAPVPGAGDAKWFAAADGGVFTEGAGARFFGSMGGQRLNALITAIVPSSTGNGYLLVGQDGGTFAFGDFPFPGSIAGIRLNAPVVDAAATADNRGVWLIAADGGVFALGNAPFLGSMANQRLNAPITAILGSASGRGYLAVGQDGGTFAFGDYPFPGSLAGTRLNAPVVDAVAYGNGLGAWLLGQDGGIFTLRSPFYGNALNEANPPPTYPGIVVGNGGLVAVPCPGGGSITVAAQIAENLRGLLTAAKDAGYNLCGSGWRDPKRQIELRKQNCGTSQYAIYQMPSNQCRIPTAIPGTSMHEKGLAIDFSNMTSMKSNWLGNNAARFGLYPCVCGEAWHYSINGH